jgi:hypothetical protein
MSYGIDAPGWSTADGHRTTAPACVASSSSSLIEPPCPSTGQSDSHSTWIKQLGSCHYDMAVVKQSRRPSSRQCPRSIPPPIATALSVGWRNRPTADPSPWGHSHRRGHLRLSVASEVGALVGAAGGGMPPPQIKLSSAALHSEGWSLHDRNSTLAKRVVVDRSIVSCVPGLG